MGSTAAQADTSTKTQGSTTAIVVTALALFSMFFGAGNLIFPPMIAVQAGDNFWPAILGFLGTGALLPLLAVIAIALSGANVRDLAQRAGTVFGVVFPILAYLSIGAFYALPRTGAVSMETAITPLFGVEGIVASAIFNIIFFGIALALSWNPNTIMEKLGKFLTPALLILLVVMIVVALTKWTASPSEPAEEFAARPFTEGLLQGYLTMDSIAALAFSIVVISTLRFRGFQEGPALVRGTIYAGAGAGLLLALIYLGLGTIGRIIPNPAQYDNGAALLSDASNLTLGTAGQIVFALIVLLACITTAVGLITATAEYFSEQFAGSYKTWAIIFTIMSTLIATQGLEFVMAIAAPVIGFLYPPAIALILVTLIEPLFRSRTRFTWAFFLPIWVAVIWSAIETAISLGWAADVLTPLVAWAPLQDAGLGWVVPVAIAFAIGLAIDLARPKSPLKLGTVETVEGDHVNA
ncbi:branched-chain amino acid transport system II carrier protein [Corynebacterium sanguinis]|uniref:branched-chain amino acid transport system II carrier protein n=1 Tax=Corynebacterium sanguinis TaxID=2594913 RepID=UPI0011AA727A|nr:branched-chain amino acid transport system II carrier protein [Corynebacterium sanguinis]MCT1411302.1 branched-chain amino acid transport system II carrier protein [Corynebacterium sanguinis]MCT1414163.1 branched-chain amino acid transport system II carrier protein [Corynebacterium sanguinis]MCT1583986.1 branched-chain amino acid transport system II carrier protein [Corynebacterium sanguinis]MCT1663207.1 branched-chain amino acid transport system II carrier protein [Corynebacterium sanguinis